MEEYTKVKKILVTLLFTVMLASSTVHARRFLMDNQTNKILLVQVELLLSKKPFFNLVQPSAKADFNWPLGDPLAGFCLGKIKYVVPDSYTLQQINSMRNTDGMLDNEKILQWIEKNENKYPRKEAEIQWKGLPDSSSYRGHRSLVGVAYRSIKKSISTSLCADHENIIITEDRNGNIIFSEKVY